MHNFQLQNTQLYPHKAVNKIPQSSAKRLTFIQKIWLICSPTTMKRNTWARQFSSTKSTKTILMKGRLCWRKTGSQGWGTFIFKGMIRLVGQQSLTVFSNNIHKAKADSLNRWPADQRCLELLVEIFLEMTNTSSKPVLHLLTKNDRVSILLTVWLAPPSL